MNAASAEGAARFLTCRRATRCAHFRGERVTVCGLIIADRSHHQITGDQMKFITICDYTGIIECEIFAQTYRRFGLETVRQPVVEVEARVTAFDNGAGCTLDVLRVAKPRMLNSNNAKCR